MIGAVEILRNEYNFNGYIHAKAIPGADSAGSSPALGMLVDRMSVNIELPSQQSLQAPGPGQEPRLPS